MKNGRQTEKFHVLQFLFQIRCLITEGFADQQYFDTSFDAASSGDNDLIADTVRGKTVCTGAGDGTRRFFAEADAVLCCGNIMYTAQSLVHIRSNFIPAG